MKKFYLFALLTLMLVFLTTGCSKKKEVEQAEEIRPVKTTIVTAPETGGVRNFPGRVDANRKASLAFRVSGKVHELLVKEGDMVKQGDVIAKLDSTDFQITVNDKKARFTRAEKDYKRGKKLVKDGNISKRDFDQLEAAYLSSKADFNLAKQQLLYTDLKAPFDGTIARRFIQKFEEVQAKQEIVALNDNEILEVKIDVPENLLLGIQRHEGVDDIGKSRAKDQIPVFASFQSQRDKEYKLSFKEIATKADKNTQTFTITYTMPKPTSIILLPGMTASVTLDLSDYMAKAESFYLPVSAVVADVKLQGIVWIVNEETMQVEQVSVKVGTMRDNRIQIKEGLQEGQRVVTAGVPFLYKGLKVSIMKNPEQAEDNLQHERPVMENNQNTPKEG
ncbi:MAG: efflux RND transporter periplasmic adaptor subunit [Gammaproteobacteria bacterium]|nr:efflux RND transporter periplasmic adaptor subunit [Gammaproteobacteria bacterium]